MQCTPKARYPTLVYSVYFACSSWRVFRDFIRVNIAMDGHGGTGPEQSANNCAGEGTLVAGRV